MFLIYYALIFFLLSLVAGLFGFTSIAVGFRFIARIFFGIFLFIALIILAGVLIFGWAL